MRFHHGSLPDPETQIRAEECLRNIKSKVIEKTQVRKLVELEDGSVVFSGTKENPTAILTMSIIKTDGEFYLYADMDDEVFWQEWDFESQSQFEDAVVDYLIPFVDGTAVKRENKVIYDIKKLADDICGRFPDIPWERAETAQTVTLTCPNRDNLRFPLIVTCDAAQGVFIDLSPCGSVVECDIGLDYLEGFIKDILSDRIVVAVAYPNEEAFVSQTRCSMTRSFALRDGGDDGLDSFLCRVSKRRSWIGRLNIFAFHGVIEVSNWSGKCYHKIYRK